MSDGAGVARRDVLGEPPETRLAARVWSRYPGTPCHCGQSCDGRPVRRHGRARLADVLFFGFTTAVLLYHVLADREVTADTLYGAVCVYLLSGVMWASLYGLVELLQPHAFQASSGQGVTRSDLLFFSFVTLTTLGYGDITPVTSPARSLAVVEAVFGVLYNALLIARLVGLYRPGAPSPRP